MTMLGTGLGDMDDVGDSGRAERVPPRPGAQNPSPSPSGAIEGLRLPTRAARALSPRAPRDTPRKGGRSSSGIIRVPAPPGRENGSGRGLGRLGRRQLRPGTARTTPPGPTSGFPPLVTMLVNAGVQKGSSSLSATTWRLTMFQFFLALGSLFLVAPNAATAPVFNSVAEPRPLVKSGFVMSASHTSALLVRSISNLESSGSKTLCLRCPRLMFASPLFSFSNFAFLTCRTIIKPAKIVTKKASAPATPTMTIFGLAADA